MKMYYWIIGAVFLAVGYSDGGNTQSAVASVVLKDTTTVPKMPVTQNYFTQSKDTSSFSHPVKGLDNDAEDKFALGKSFFRIPWVGAHAATTARDGLGPLFSANTCIHCHPHNGAGVAVDKEGKMNRSLLLRLSHRNTQDKEALKTKGFEPDSTYGAQLSIHANHGVRAEAKIDVTYEALSGHYAEGTAYTLQKPTYHVSALGYGAFDADTLVAPRIGLALVGLGLLEQIPEQAILSSVDEEDKNQDGISGKANFVFDSETNSTVLGRFTWKASASSIKQQVAAAAHNDMGLSNPFFPTDNCTQKQKECLEQADTTTLDLPQKRLDAITFYLQNLAIPTQRKSSHFEEGKALFETLQCTACHTPSFSTHQGLSISAYSDLLLHDMGEGLADGRSEFLATGSEWRTPPLWGIGLYEKVSGEANFLHDGRARNIEEAILWHGGEAEQSKKAFMALDKQSREILHDFLHSI